MSRIREKLSKIFASQIPEFIRAGEYNATNIQIVSTTASSKIVVVGDTFDIIAGDKLQHPAITNTVFVTKILSSTKLEVSNAIAVTLTNQTAKFIRADSTSTFVKFLEAYYKFLEQDQGPQEILQNVRKYGDSEYTTDALIDQFFKNYGNDIPRNIVTDKRNFIKNFRDIYKTKGTEEAYKLLFRVMFNSNAEFFYPSEVVLRPSDGVWKKDTTIRVITTGTDSGDPFNFKNTKITGQTSNATATVDNVLKFFIDGLEVYELTLENVTGIFVQETIIGRKLVNLNSPLVTVTATTTPQLSKIDIIDGAMGYKNDELVIISGGGLGRINGVDGSGKIKSIRIIESGRYPILSSIAAASNTTIAPVIVPAPTGIVSGNVILLSNVGSFISDTPHGLSKGRYANIYFSNLANVSENTFTVTSILDSKRFLFNFYDPNINPAVQIEVNANIRYTQPANLFANVNIIKESAGYWLNNKGKLSELVYVHGPALNSIDRSKIFYQPYSYVIKSDVSIAEWDATASQLVHPAGTQVFGEIDINKEISGNLEAPGLTEVWDYFGLTADTTKFDASLTLYTNSRVANLSVTTDMVYTLFGYL
jgi:hypothetical protein